VLEDEPVEAAGATFLGPKCRILDFLQQRFVCFDCLIVRFKIVNGLDYIKIHCAYSHSCKRKNKKISVSLSYLLLLLEVSLVPALID